MIDNLILSIAIGALASTLVFSEPYRYALQFLRLDVKPFNCAVCLSYWSLFVYGTLTNPIWILFAGVAALSANLATKTFYEL
jgi:hypothetical protein